MIGWHDIYKVVEAMAPLYFALILGYASVKWCHIIKPDQCIAIDKLVCFFTLPLYCFEFVANANPYTMNYKFIGADTISKVVVVVVLALLAKFSKKDNWLDWCITSFSLATLTNALVIGVPLVQAMYGPKAVDLIVQASILQSIIWLTILLFVLEVRKARSDIPSRTTNTTTDVQGEETSITNIPRTSFLALMKIVCLKLIHNPNAYASIFGLIWALMANRWHFQMPSIIEGCISIMSRAATGTAMFSMGLFMALQEKLIACGTSLALYGMVLKFVVGPGTMAIGCIVVGLHGEILRVAIMQAAMPQAIISFIFAQEYGLHANVLSTAVTFGMIVSLPILIGYYCLLGFLH